MQVSDVIKNEYHNNTYGSMRLLTWILKIFALNWNVKPTHSKLYVIVKSVFTILALGGVHFFCLYYKIKHVYSKMEISIRLTDIIQIISDFSQYLVDLYYIYQYGRNICLVYLNQYEKIDEFLDVKCYSVLRRKLLKIMAFFLMILLICSLCDLGAWVVTYGWFTPLSHSLSYIFLLIKMLTSLDFIAHVLHIEARLRIISYLVQRCYDSTAICPAGQMADCVLNKNWLYRQDRTIPDNSRYSRSNDSFEIKRVTKCYLLLTEQVTFINKMYGFRILLNTLSLLLDMVKTMNLSIRIAIGSQRSIYNNAFLNFLPGVSGMMRFLTCAAIVISLVHQCEQAYRQRHEIINVIDHFLVNKNPDSELRSAILVLRSFLQERPISFNMANFTTLNYSLLVSIASVVVTYTIILVQSVN